MGIQKFCLQTQKFCLQIQKFCLRIQKFCLRIKKLCLRILKFCLRIQKLCLLLSWIWGGGTYAERCKTRLYWPVSIGVTAWQHPQLVTRDRWTQIVLLTSSYMHNVMQANRQPGHVTYLWLGNWAKLAATGWQKNVYFLTHYNIHRSLNKSNLHAPVQT